jgi:tRNA nucleotidyltransferase (CCA-adding enzyme)
VGFRFFDHTADIGLVVSAPTVSALFEEAAVALTAVLSGSAPVDPSERVSVSLTACSVEQLLVDWLVELLGRFDIELWLTGSGQLLVEQRGDSWHLGGVIAGASLDPRGQTAALPVKGITYHRLSVRQTTDGWWATIVLDV